jgi:hypothetical protein
MAALLQPLDFVRLTGDGLTEEVQITGAWGGATPVVFAPAVTNSYREGAVLSLSRVAARAGTNTVQVVSSRSFYVGALVELDNTTHREYFTVNLIAGNVLTLSGNTTRVYNIGNRIRLAELKLSVRHLNERERIDALETFDGLTMNAAVPNKYIVAIVNARSELIRLTDLPAPAVAFDNPTTADGSWQRLSNGNDGTMPVDEAFVGEDNGPGQRTGIVSMTDIDQVSIIAVPGKTARVIANSLIGHCELLKDRFAVLDPPPGASLQAVQNYRNNFDTKYAALYYPQIIIDDPLSEADLIIPPRGTSSASTPAPTLSEASTRPRPTRSSAGSLTWSSRSTKASMTSSILRPSTSTSCATFGLTDAACAFGARGSLPAIRIGNTSTSADCLSLSKNPSIRERSGSCSNRMTSPCGPEYAGRSAPSCAMCGVMAPCKGARRRKPTLSNATARP